MICLEPSSLSLGNLEIRHGAGPGALLNADRPTHLASQAQDQARGGSPSLGRNVLDSHPSYAGAGAGAGKVCHGPGSTPTSNPSAAATQISHPNRPVSLLGRLFSSPHHQLRATTTTTSTGLPERSRCFEGRTITPVPCFSRDTALDCLTYLYTLTFVYFSLRMGSLTLTQPSLLPIVALNRPLGTT